MFNVADAILRLRTGAQAPETEIRRYLNSLGFSALDAPSTTQFKLDRLKQDLQRVLELNTQGYSPVNVGNQQTQQTYGI